jgi:hypothetical protein
VRERSCCRCPLCRIETELLKDFLDPGQLNRCSQILSAAPELAVFSEPGPLLEHLRLCRETSSSDAILHALLQARRIFANGIAERLFILAFVPSMHTSVRQAVKRYPQLSPDDASQQAFESLLRFLDSDQLHRRRNYLGFAISRRLKRAIFEWAEREMLVRVLEPGDNGLDLLASDDSFERLAQLRHFLDRAVRRGVLNGAELDVLIRFKLEGGSENGIPDGSSNAHRQRLKRLLLKLRRLAEGPGSQRKRQRRL